MLYIILSIVLVVTISAYVRKKSQSKLLSTETETEEPLSVPDHAKTHERAAEEQQTAQKDGEVISVPVIEKESADESSSIKPLVAPPLTSPGVSASTVYSSSGEIIRAPDSVKRDAYGLHWNNRSSELSVNGLVIKGAMVYWADGKPGIDEPSCIDITLPFEITNTDDHIKSGAESYAMMTPSQRGGYLMWLAGGRNFMPSDSSWILLWFMGIERRALLDKQDISLCIIESLRMLQMTRNEKLNNNMKNLSIWLTVKYMLPEEQILKLIQNMKDTPIEFFSMILSRYSNANLPLPSYLAYIVMCNSPIAGRVAPYTENLVNAFAGIYKNQTDGGLILATPRSRLSLTYVSINASISENKRKQEIIDLPDFFKDTTQFKPLVDSWDDFIKKYEDNCFEDETGELKIKRTDWEPFIQENLKGGELPLIIKLSDLASFLKIDQIEKPSSTDRKGISEVARIEGYLVIPELCISGKEYKWEDKIALTSIDLGEKISDDYNSAALFFEFIFALVGENAGKYGGAEEILNTIIKYFSLVNEELARLNILPRIIDNDTKSPDNLGECLQTWLKTEEREYIRNVVFQMLNLSDTTSHVGQISEKLHQILDIKPETFEKIETPLPLTGEKLVSFLSTLFKNR